jgi:hypothetical protein
MPLYRVVRGFPTPLTDGDVDAARIRATTCAPRFPGVRWLRSFLERERKTLTCFYEAPDPDAIRRHAEAAKLPVDAVAEVVEILPSA